MNNDIIKSIEIVLGKATVRITPEEAQKLYGELTELLGKQMAGPTYVPYPVPYPQPQPWRSPYWYTTTLPVITGTATTSDCATSGYISIQ